MGGLFGFRVSCVLFVFCCLYYCFVVFCFVFQLDLFGLIAFLYGPYIIFCIFK